MDIITSGQPFFGLQRPYIMLAHSFHPERMEFHAAARETTLPGTILDADYTSADLEINPLRHHEWRWMAYDVADYVLFNLDHSSEAFCEFGAQAGAGKLIFCGEIPDEPKKFYQFFIETYKIPVIGKPNDFFDYLVDHRTEDSDPLIG